MNKDIFNPEKAAQVPPVWLRFPAGMAYALNVAARGLASVLAGKRADNNSGIPTDSGEERLKNGNYGM